MSNFFKRWGPAAALTAAGILAGTTGQAQIIDGTRDGAYLTAPLAVQTVNTNYGDSGLGQQEYATGSEIDNISAQVDGTDLVIFIGGNLESNFNKLVLLFDSKAGGQQTLGGGTNNFAGLNGLKLDAGFGADYALRSEGGYNGTGYGIYTKYSPIPAVNAPGLSDEVGGGTGRTQVLDFGLAVSGAGLGQMSIDNNNTAGVGSGTGTPNAGDALAVTTGYEIRIPLNALGTTPGAGGIKICAFITNSNGNELSNQILAGAPAGTNNLGPASAANLSNLGPNATPGTQFVTVPNGTGILNPDIAVAPTTVAFGNVGVSTGVATKTFTISNNGTSNLIVTSIVSSNPIFTVDITADNLAPSTSQIVTVSYDPSAAVTSTGTITIDSNDPGSPLVVLNVNGTGTPAGQIVLDGRLDAGGLYGPIRAVQTVATSFGNNASELNGAYVAIRNNALYVLLTGNLTGNKVALFVDTDPNNGQNVLANNGNIGGGNMNGLTFDGGFAPDYLIGTGISGSSAFINYVPTPAGGGGANTYLSTGTTGTALTQFLEFGGGIQGEFSYNGTNNAGVGDAANNPAAVTTGLEFRIPLSQLGSPSSTVPVRICAFVVNNSYDFYANQFLGALPVGSTNHVGSTANLTTFAGNQFINVRRGPITVSDTRTIGGDYTTVTVLAGGQATVNGPTNASGAVVVQNGGRLSFQGQADAALTGTGSFALVNNSTLQIGSTAGIAASGATGNIQTTGRSFSNQANYIYGRPAGTSFQAGSGLPSVVRSLRVLPGSGPGNLLTLTQPVAVSEKVTLGGNINLDGHKLRLRSNSGGTALIDNLLGAGGTITGPTGEMECYLNRDYAAGAYRHFGSPTTGMTVGGLATNGFTPIVDPLYNTATPPTYTRATFPNVFTFDEAIGSTNFEAGYQSPGALGNAMTPGTGFSVRSSAGSKFVFKGTFFAADQAVNMTRTGTNGFNLKANPFASPLDWGSGAITIPAGMSAQVSVQKPMASPTGNGGTYLTYTNGLGTGDLAGGIIPAMQGVFLRRNSGNGSFTFPQAARVTTFNAATTHYRTANTDPRPMVRLFVEGTGTMATVKDEAIVYFEAGATADEDDRYDAVRVAPSSGIWPSLSTRLANGTLAQIDGRPLTGATTIVPLDVRVNVSGTYVINAREMRNIGGSQPLALVDALTGTVQNLRTNPTYSFSMLRTATGPRFSLRFGAGTVTSVEENAAVSALLNVFPNPSNGTVNVEWNGAERLSGSLTVTDLLGRTVRTVSAAGLDRLTLTNLPKGVYSLRVVTAAGPLTRRVVVE